MSAIMMSAGTLRRVAAAAVMAAGLGACAFDQSAAPNLPVNKNEVRQVTLRHDVVFRTASTRLDPASRIGLQRFVARNGLRAGDRVIVAAGTVGPANRATRRARIRGIRVSNYLSRKGIVVVRSGKPAEGIGARVVTVSAVRHVVVAPNCPDWNAATGKWSIDGSPTRFGCINASALASMIHDPTDLTKGGTLDPGDGGALSHGYQRYRAGKATKPQGSQTN